MAARRPLVGFGATPQQSNDLKRRTPFAFTGSVLQFINQIKFYRTHVNVVKRVNQYKEIENLKLHTHERDRKSKLTEEDIETIKNEVLNNLDITMSEIKKT